MDNLIKILNNKLEQSFIKYNIHILNLPVYIKIFIHIFIYTKLLKPQQQYHKRRNPYKLKKCV